MSPAVFWLSAAGVVLGATAGLALETGLQPVHPQRWPALLGGGLLGFFAAMLLGLPVLMWIERSPLS